MKRCSTEVENIPNFLNDFSKKEAGLPIREKPASIQMLMRQIDSENLRTVIKHFYPLISLLRILFDINSTIKISTISPIKIEPTSDHL